MLTQSFELNPVGIQLLLTSSDKMYSPSFAEAWNTMRSVRRGDINIATAEQRLRRNIWTAHFPTDALIASCLASVATRMSSSSSLSRESAGEAYTYFDPPLLKWIGDTPILEYTLQSRPPVWIEVDRLMFVSGNPVKKEPIVVNDGSWSFSYSPLSISLSAHHSTEFTFDLQVRGSSLLSEPSAVSIVPEDGFAFFNSSGAIIDPGTSSVPLGDPVALLHSADARFEGAPPALSYRSVLGGSYRLTRFPSGIGERFILLDRSEKLLWENTPVNRQNNEVPLNVDLTGGRWGTPVTLKLPITDFVPQRIRLNSGEIIDISQSGDSSKASLTPALSRAKGGRLHGYAGVRPKSVKVELRHRSQQYGAAIDARGGWRALQETDTVDTSLLRTSRLLGESRDRDFDPEEARWMEGDHVIARPRQFGTVLSGCDGVGAALCLASKIYNSNEPGLRAAAAVIDVGELRSLTRHGDGSWSARLPFEEHMSADHCLWGWISEYKTPIPIPMDCVTQKGQEIRWCYKTKEVFGWALSFRGSRVGSSCVESALPLFAEHLSDGNWPSNAAWIRWWHCPVHHGSWRKKIQKLSLAAPVETCAAWLLPAVFHSGLVHDEGREEAWASVCREMLWSWMPTGTEAKELMASLGIWCGDIGKDSSGISTETVGKLARCNPLLLANAAGLAASELYAFPRQQLVVLLRLLLDAINPNANRNGFDIRTLCDRYAQGENRLDGEFIMRSLVEDARRFFAGKLKDPRNLRVAFHSAGLREIVSIALLLDTIKAWEGRGNN